MQNKIIVSILTFFILVDTILIYLALTISPIKLKRNVLARLLDDGCIFLFDVLIYYWFYFMGVED